MDDDAHVLSSTNPTGGPSAWKVVAKDNNENGGDITGVSCGSERLCVAVDGGGGMLSSTAPSTKAWRFADVLPPTGDPQSDGATVVTYSFAAVSCASNQLCVAIDTAFGVGDFGYEGAEANVSTNPTDSGSWDDTGIQTSENVSAISCPSTRLCIAVDDSGLAVVGTSS
jgi:hypothetical protein